MTGSSSSIFQKMVSAIYLDAGSFICLRALAGFEAGCLEAVLRRSHFWVDELFGILLEGFQQLLAG